MGFVIEFVGKAFAFALFVAAECAEAVFFTGLLKSARCVCSLSASIWGICVSVSGLPDAAADFACWSNSPMIVLVSRSVLPDVFGVS